jgi:hypothetical protein
VPARQERPPPMIAGAANPAWDETGSVARAHVSVRCDRPSPLTADDRRPRSRFSMWLTRKSLRASGTIPQTVPLAVAASADPARLRSSMGLGAGVGPARTAILTPRRWAGRPSVSKLVDTGKTEPLFRTRVLDTRSPCKPLRRLVYGRMRDGPRLRKQNQALSRLGGRTRRLE